MADHSYYKIDDHNTERTSPFIRYPDTFADLVATLMVERHIPDDVEVYFVTNTRLFTVGDLRRELERH